MFLEKGAVLYDERKKSLNCNNIKIGQVEDMQAGTGCTVFICENGMAAGLDVRGGGPASRESELLKPLAAQVTSEAILRAVNHCESAFDFISASSRKE